MIVRLHKPGELGFTVDVEMPAAPRKGDMIRINEPVDLVKTTVRPGAMRCRTGPADGPREPRPRSRCA